MIYADRYQEMRDEKLPLYTTSGPEVLLCLLRGGKG
jgi:hypothetical protein